MDFGRSLEVPCVQEQAKETLTVVPPRYIRLDQDPPFIDSSIIKSFPQIPVIDMHNLLSKELIDSELHKLHGACKDWGFFQLINHGVSDSLVWKVKSEIQELFNIPMGEREKLCKKPGDSEGFGQVAVVSEEQKLDWADMFYITTLPTHLRHPYVFPNLPSTLRDTVEAYAIELRNLTMKILVFMEKALGMETNEIREVFEEGYQSMRMNYYPPCPQPDLVMGLCPHSDPGGLTILLQVNELEGLQVKKDGMWVPVKPLPDAFIVNLGDILEIMSNGVYRSIEHRATVNSAKERLSIATFHNPKFDEEIGPVSSLVTPERPAVFQRIRVSDYFRGYFSRELKGKSYLDMIRSSK